MLKALGVLIMLAVAFGFGYYIGQRPVDELKKTAHELSEKLVDAKRALADLSRKAVDATLGIERNLRVRQGLVDAKSQLIQAKSDLLDKNFGNAAKEMAEVVTDLEKASEAAEHSGQASKIKALATKAREAQKELAAGKSIPRSRLDEIQQEVDSLTQ